MVQIWARKYVQLLTSEGRLCYAQTIARSNLWNWAQSSKDMVQQNAFWDVKDRDKANFWDKSWQQMARLNEKYDLEEI